MEEFGLMPQQFHKTQRLSQPDQVNLEDLIRELSRMHAEMLELETDGMSKATNIHPASGTIS